MDLPQIVTDALTWESIKFIGSKIVAAVLMTAAGRYLLTHVFNRLKKRQERIAYWVAMPLLLLVFLISVGGSNDALTRPRLIAVIEQVFVGNFEAKEASNFDVLLVVSLRNSSSIPTAAMSWKVRIKDRESIDCAITNMPERLPINSPARGSFPSRTVTYYASDLLPAKALSPISQGSIVTGLLLCRTSNFQVDAARHEISISFQDAFANEYDVKFKPRGGISDLLYFPGIKQTF